MMTLLSLAICFGVPVILIASIEAKHVVLLVGAIVPIVILVGAAAFTVRGYSIQNGTLLIHRLGWSSHVPLSSLTGVETDPTALQESIRIFGNGGAFGFSGWAYHSRLGRFLVYATDPSRSVVLRFPQRNVLITPEDPALFIEEVKKCQA